MERVAFLIEQTGERVFAMTNPDELTFERQSGVSMRRRNDRPLAPARRTDDPMILTGGGITDLKLNLLFDVDLLSRTSTTFAQAPDFRTNLEAPPAHALSRQTVPEGKRAPDVAGTGESQLTITDVRELSGPLWHLAENGSQGNVTEGPGLVHFIWGAAWNVPCIVLSVAERFDQFSDDGTPLRSWVRIHLRRTQLPAPGETTQRPAPAAAAGMRGGSTSMPESVVVTDPTSGSRPDLMCDGVYGDLTLLHSWLRFNRVDDVWSLDPGQVLQTPPASSLRDQAE